MAQRFISKVETKYMLTIDVYGDVIEDESPDEADLFNYWLDQIEIKEKQNEEELFNKGTINKVAEDSK